jgi:16S rRNA processing protein RimM
MSDWVVVGSFLAAYGVKGWVKVHSHTEPMDNIASYQPLWIQKNGFWLELQVEQFKPHGKGLIAKVKDCDNRELTAGLTGCDIGIKREQLPDLQQGDYYWSDLEGLTVLSNQRIRLGKVDRVFETGSNDVLVIVPDERSIDNRQRLVPYLPGNVVLEVNLEQGCIIVDWDPEF